MRSLCQKPSRALPAPARVKAAPRALVLFLCRDCCCVLATGDQGDPPSRSLSNFGHGVHGAQLWVAIARRARAGPERCRVLVCVFSVFLRFASLCLWRVVLRSARSVSLRARQDVSLQSAQHSGERRSLAHPLSHPAGVSAPGGPGGPPPWSREQANRQRKGNRVRECQCIYRANRPRSPTAQPAPTEPHTHVTADTDS